VSAVDDATSVVPPAIAEDIRKAAGLPDPDLIEMDSDYFTIDEIDIIEQLTGEDFTKFMNTPGPKAGHFKILAFVIKRRTDPEFPFERAGQLKAKFTKTPVPPTNGNGSGPA
jgi:hypothetical protein